jgi:hypothetical protein
MWNVDMETTIKEDKTQQKLKSWDAQQRTVYAIKELKVDPTQKNSRI